MGPRPTPDEDTAASNPQTPDMRGAAYQVNFPAKAYKKQLILVGLTEDLVSCSLNYHVQREILETQV